MSNKRILIFNVNWLGDVLFSTAAIRNIRRNFPQSYLACIIPSRCYPILKDNPYLDEIIVFDEKDRHKSIFAKLKFIAYLRARQFDKVYLLHRSFSRALLVFLAGIPERIGYRSLKRSWLLTKKIKTPVKDSLHRIDYYLNIIEQAGLRVEDRFSDFFFSEKEAAFVNDYLQKEKINRQDFLVVVSPAGNWPPKRWPAVYFAQLLDRLIEEFKARVVISADIQDKDIVKNILENMREKAIDAAGRFNLKQLAALLKQAELFIVADTGPLHIAATVGTKKIIALFGPTSLHLTGPYPLRNAVILQQDVGCRIPCYVVNCPDNRCMKAITVDDVLEAVRKIKT